MRLGRFASGTALLASFTFAVWSAAAAGPPQAAGPDFAAVDAYVEARMKEKRIPGLALAIVQGDQVAYLKGYGIADPSGRPVTPQTPFFLASLAKPMTALAVMQLVEQGKLELDTPVQTYLPWFHLADSGASARISVRHLLYHTSGLPERTGIEYAGGARPGSRCDRATGASSPGRATQPPRGYIV